MARLELVVPPNADGRKALPGRDRTSAFRRLRAVSVLDEDLELAALLAEDRLGAAKSRSRAPVVQVSRGTWQEPEWPAAVRQGPGLPILGGLMLRRLGLQGAPGTLAVKAHSRETGVLMILWHLADRCGTIGSDRSLVPIDLSHSILAELVAARRPAVSTAIASIQRAG